MTRNCEIGEVLDKAVEISGSSLPQSDDRVSAHIAVCVCTYRRPALLDRLLERLEMQEVDRLFTYSIVVIDNDALESAREVIDTFRKSSRLGVMYDVAPQQSIAMARNRAVANAPGDYVAFIDDDEFPDPKWLLTLFRAVQEYKVDGVLGPVKRYFDQTPPKWVLKGDFYERPTYPTGLVIDWRKGRTGNVLLKRHLFVDESAPFRPEFRQGEDQDFFHRMIEKGYRFIWCNEAVAYEVVPPSRWSRKFMLRRALLRGAMEPQTADFGFWSLVKSLVAVPLYTVTLPFAALRGQHKLITNMVSLCDHLGKVLAVLGINPVKEEYVTE